MDLSALLWLFIELILIGCAFGVVLFIVSVLPIPDPFKGWLRIAVLVLGAILILFWIVSILGGGPHPLFMRR
jgi:small basic protein